jgi:hypothetical protein
MQQRNLRLQRGQALLHITHILPQPINIFVDPPQETQD